MRRGLFKDFVFNSFLCIKILSPIVAPPYPTDTWRLVPGNHDLIKLESTFKMMLPTSWNFSDQMNFEIFLKIQTKCQKKNNNSGSEKEDENVKRTRKLAAMWYMYWMMGPPPPPTHTYTQTKQKQNKIKIKQKGQKQNSRTAIKTTAHVCTIQFSKIPTCPYSRKYKLLLPYHKTYNVPKYTRILYSIDSKKYNINSKLAGQIVATFSGLLWNSEDIKQVLPMFYVINDFLFTVVSDVNEKLNHKFMNNMWGTHPAIPPSVRLI